PRAGAGCRGGGRSAMPHAAWWGSARACRLPSWCSPDDLRRWRILPRSLSPLLFFLETECAFHCRLAAADQRARECLGARGIAALVCVGKTGIGGYIGGFVRQDVGEELLGTVVAGAERVVRQSICDVVASVDELFPEIAGEVLQSRQIAGAAFHG